MSNPTPSRYQWTFRGVSFDFYRLCEVLGIVHHAQAHALKKVIRAGRSVKPLVQDIDEAIACLQRWREMVVEDEIKEVIAVTNKDHPVPMRWGPVGVWDRKNPGHPLPAPYGGKEATWEDIVRADDEERKRQPEAKP